jgi:hypothetical protein
MPPRVRTHDQYSPPTPSINPFEDPESSSPAPSQIGYYDYSRSAHNALNHTKAGLHKKMRLLAIVVSISLALALSALLSVTATLAALFMTLTLKTGATSKIGIWLSLSIACMIFFAIVSVMLYYHRHQVASELKSHDVEVASRGQRDGMEIHSRPPSGMIDRASSVDTDITGFIQWLQSKNMVLMNHARVLERRLEETETALRLLDQGSELMTLYGNSPPQSIRQVRKNLPSRHLHSRSFAENTLNLSISPRSSSGAVAAHETPLAIPERTYTAESPPFLRPVPMHTMQPTTMESTGSIFDSPLSPLSFTPATKKASMSTPRPIPATNLPSASMRDGPVRRPTSILSHPALVHRPNEPDGAVGDEQESSPESRRSLHRVEMFTAMSPTARIAYYENKRAREKELQSKPGVQVAAPL